CKTRDVLGTVGQVAVHEEDVLEPALGSPRRARDHGRAIPAIHRMRDDLEPGAGSRQALQDRGRTVAGAIVYDNQRRPVRQPVQHARNLSNAALRAQDRKSTRLNSSHGSISYAVFCLKKKNKTIQNACHWYIKSPM